MLAVALLVSVSDSAAFHQTTISQNVHRVVLFSSSASTNAPSDEKIRNDIEAMREEAKLRLKTLNGQMEDMHRKQEQGNSFFLHASTFEDAHVPLTTTTTATATDKGIDHTIDSLTSLISVQDIPTIPPSHITDSRKLYDTRWKVVIRVGNTRQATVLEGIEKLLLVHLEVDFTSETLGESDDLLQGSNNVLRVRESWVGASSLTEGHQHDVAVKATGGWKILAGQGPRGIDILRWYIDVEEEICHDPKTSDVRVPAKRVYCTCGVFSMEHHSESEAHKDNLRGELDQLVIQYEDLTLEDERDGRLISFDQVRRAKHLIGLRAQIKAASKSITNARIRDPEKGLLRLSRRGDIGITKEGQVCYRDKKEGNISAEYLVLGRFEAASVGRSMRKRQSKPKNELRP